MQASLRHSLLSAPLVAMGSILFTATAGAMGPSTTPNVPTADRVSRIEAEPRNAVTALQSQVEALRQEVGILKARVERHDLKVAR